MCEQPNAEKSSHQKYICVPKVIIVQNGSRLMVFIEFYARQNADLKQITMALTAFFDHALVKFKRLFHLKS